MRDQQGIRPKYPKDEKETTLAYCEGTLHDVLMIPISVSTKKYCTRPTLQGDTRNSPERLFLVKDNLSRAWSWPSSGGIVPAKYAVGRASGPKQSSAVQVDDIAQFVWM